MLSAVIFDFDGVIADSETMHFNAFNQSLEPYNHQITMQDYYSKYLGLTDFDLIKQLISEKLIDVEPEQAGELAEHKKQIFNKMIENDCNIINGVAEFLRLLEDNNIAIAICSGALLCEIELVLNKAGLQHYFETIVSAEQVASGKPAPDGFLLALKRLNEKRSGTIEPGRCVVVEDSHWGLQATAAAKMHSIAVTNSYAAEELKSADIVVDNLRQLTIEKLNQICN